MTRVKLYRTGSNSTDGTIADLDLDLVPVAGDTFVVSRYSGDAVSYRVLARYFHGTIDRNGRQDRQVLVALEVEDVTTGSDSLEAAP